MNYTQSDSFATHSGTGQRMHVERQAVPTAWSDKDANMIIWSLMEVIKAGGVAGVEFDPDVPSTYQALLLAIRNIYAASSSDLPGRVSIFLQPTPPVGWLRANGALLSRTTYSALWAHVQTVGAVSEADWAGGRWGWFGVGDGSTTFRLPDLRGVVLRGLDGGRGFDPDRVIGSFQGSQNLSHTHSTGGAGAHGHSASSDAAGAHNHTISSMVQVDGGDNYMNRWSVGAGTHSTDWAGQHSHTISVGSVGDHTHTITSEGGSEVRMSNIALPIFIKY